MARSTNRVEVPKSRQALDRLKTEVANELGIPNYDTVDKGELPARVHGYIGGNMVKKMIEYAEKNMATNEADVNQIMSNRQDLSTPGKAQNIQSTQELQGQLQ